MDKVFILPIMRVLTLRRDYFGDSEHIICVAISGSVIASLPGECDCDYKFTPGIGR